MQCLKSRDRTVLEKKKENKFRLWNELLFETEPAPRTAGQLKDEVQYIDFQLQKLLAKLFYMTLYACT